MDAVLAQFEPDPGTTLEQRRREVLLERVRSVARNHPEVLASVIVQWIDQDRINRSYDDLELYKRRRRILERTEWQVHMSSRVPGSRD